MPWGDRTGPAGLGPMTGRGAGYCAGNSVPGYMNPYGGRGYYGYGRGGGFGFGRGGGFGRGWRNGYWATGLPGWARYPYAAYGGAYAYPYTGAMTRDQEMDVLKNQAKVLEKDLEDIRKRITELESSEEEK
ncbi:MAG: hypothetical protein B6D63_07180 [Candidatus Latescibacteria bacterium 4484_7]|nr:MAG: hypothetical protein B6D63_07180 [Candidatus Latescibacteria bacterium 4484_7]